MRIASNIDAQNILTNLYNVGQNIQAEFERLGTGLRINHASDDAAGLQISQTMNTQVQGLSMAQQNVQTMTNILKTGESSLDQVQQMLTRMRTLAVQAATDGLSSDNRQAIQSEANALIDEINRLASATNFNGVALTDGTVSPIMPPVNSSATITQNIVVSSGSYLLTGLTYTTSSVTNDETTRVQLVADANPASVDMVVKQIWSNGTISIQTLTNVTSGYAYGMGGMTFYLGTIATTDIGSEPAYMYANAAVSGVTVDNSLQVQVGANQGQEVNIGIPDMRATALRINQLDLSTAIKAQHAIAVLDQGFAYVNRARGNLGAMQNRMNITLSYDQSYSVNLQSANSDVRDADMAAEISNLSRLQILQQSGTSMLAQANQQAQLTLKLLQ